ncbi:hypothetical protein ACFL07_12255 [Pseudomonadota bacterium]
MSNSETYGSQPVVLASAPGVGRAAPSLLAARPVLQAAHRYLMDSFMSEQSPPGAKERSEAERRQAQRWGLRGYV